MWKASSIAALTRSGARKASEIVMLTLRTLQPSRANSSVTGPDDPIKTKAVYSSNRDRRERPNPRHYGLHMNDWSYNCFAKALADAVADAATPRPRREVGSGLSPPGFQLSTAFLDSDNRCSFYATTKGELRVTHRFIADTALLDSDNRCSFYATTQGELRVPHRFIADTALLDSDNRCSFYATTKGELRVTHRFITDTALLDSDDRCFFDATARGELRVTHRFIGFTRISLCLAAGHNLRGWLKVLGSSFQYVYRRPGPANRLRSPYPRSENCRPRTWSQDRICPKASPPAVAEEGG
jgi:hypothetical protein